MVAQDTLASNLYSFYRGTTPIAIITLLVWCG